MTIDEVLEIHRDQVAEFGVADGARDKGLVEAALLRPQTEFYNDIIDFIYSNLEVGTFTKDNLDAWLRSNTTRS